MTRRVAVVGSGVSGLVAGWVLARDSHVTLYEADERLGGHADTHDVRVEDRTLAVDTGFIVHNERTYPTLLRLFDELGVATQESDMSMSVRDESTGLEWAGALGVRGLFPSGANLRNPRYLRMLTEIPRFHRMATRVLEGFEGSDSEDETLAAFLARGRFTDFFTESFMTPLVSAVWSTDPDHALDYPARYLFRFLDHHGMLTVFGSPTWRTVTGGSREYVERVAKNLHEVRLAAPVSAIREHATGVDVTDPAGTTTYDAVVVATHPDQALAMLAEPTPLHRELLEAMPYSRNVAQLHTDQRLLPRATRARASWNYQRREQGDGRVLVTYDLTRLQRLPGGLDAGRRGALLDHRNTSDALRPGGLDVGRQGALLDHRTTSGARQPGGLDAGRQGALLDHRNTNGALQPEDLDAGRQGALLDHRNTNGALQPEDLDAGRQGALLDHRVTGEAVPRFLVTLGGEDIVDPASVLATMDYAHPVFNPESVAAQARLPELNTARVAFAGAYHGWGFHEDGALSGRRAAEHLGGTWTEPAQPRRAPATVPETPRLYTTRITHARVEPLRNVFSYNSYTWLVDLDDLPRYGGVLGPLLRRLSSFEARDHIGSPDRSLRENLDALLAEHGIDLRGGRIRMLAQARTLGHVFNPISVFWCHRPDDTLACVVVEVHNTYGGRHAYVVHPDSHGRATVDKALYVSPFNDTSGSYHVAVPPPGDTMKVGVTLHRDGHPPFTATMTGSAGPATSWGVLRAAVRMPMAPLLGAVRIRLQGIQLWLRGLPVQPRPRTREDTPR